MKNTLLNSKEPLSSYEKDSNSLKGLFLALPRINLIDRYIYQLHLNHVFGCLQSVLEHDKKFKYREKPSFIDFSFTKESLLKPKIENDKIILSHSETLFLNNIYFEEELNRRFLNFRDYLDSFLFNYKSQYRYKTISFLKLLKSYTFKNLTENSRVIGPDLDYPLFKDLVNHNLKLATNLVEEAISNLESFGNERLNSKDKLLLLATKSDDQNLTSFIKLLNEESLTLFLLKWENKAFDALKLLVDNSSDKTSHNFRFIYLLIYPESFEPYKNILNALPYEFDLGTIQRYFNELETNSKNDLLRSEKNCNDVKKKIETLLN